MALQVDGETRLFLIVGDPIGQVKSPAELSARMAARGVNALVLPAEVAPADLAGFLAGVRRLRNLDGMIATVPHKAAALAWCDAASERAVLAGGANVLCRKPDGSWSGDHTDGQGMLDALAEAGFAPEGKRALLVGTGGAGAAIAAEILARGAVYLALHDLDAERRDALLGRLEGRYPGRVGIGTADPRGYDLVVNATPLGMREGDPLPVTAEHLSADQVLADAVTKPAVTPFLAVGRALGCRTVTGGEMFAAQADLLVRLLLGG